MGSADGAPGFGPLVDAMASQFGLAGTSAMLEDMNDHNGDWDVVYPFSAVRFTSLSRPIPLLTKALVLVHGAVQSTLSDRERLRLTVREGPTTRVYRASGK